MKQEILELQRLLSKQYILLIASGALKRSNKNLNQAKNLNIEVLCKLDCLAEKINKESL